MADNKKEHPAITGLKKAIMQSPAGAERKSFVERVMSVDKRIPPADAVKQVKQQDEDYKDLADRQNAAHGWASTRKK